MSCIYPSCMMGGAGCPDESDCIAEEKARAEELLKKWIRTDVLNEDFFLKVILEWKYGWANQTQNNEQDFQNYFRRAMGVDANMIHSLALKLVKAVEERGGKRET